MGEDTTPSPWHLHQIDPHSPQAPPTKRPSSNFKLTSLTAPLEVPQPRNPRLNLRTVLELLHDDHLQGTPSPKTNQLTPFGKCPHKKLCSAKAVVHLGYSHGRRGSLRLVPHQGSRWHGLRGGLRADNHWRRKHWSVHIFEPHPQSRDAQMIIGEKPTSIENVLWESCPTRVGAEAGIGAETS